jgi:hypothetical protein
MIRRHLIHLALVPALAAAALGPSGASAMPARDPVAPVVRHEMLPARVDAAAHAATMRAIGAARMEQSCG